MNHMRAPRTQRRLEQEREKDRKNFEERRARVKAAYERRMEGDTHGADDDGWSEPLTETDIDVTGMRRTRCTACNDCTGFVLVYRQRDTTDAEIMFNCTA